MPSRKHLRFVGLCQLALRLSPQQFFSTESAADSLLLSEAVYSNGQVFLLLNVAQACEVAQGAPASQLVYILLSWCAGQALHGGMQGGIQSAEGAAD